MINDETGTVHSVSSLHLYKRISWSAILVGALVGVGLSFLLNLFGVTIGLSAFASEGSTAPTLAIGGLIGLLIGSIVSMLVAGYAAGYLGRYFCPMRNLGILYGFATWSATLLLMVLLAAPMTDYVTNYANTVTHSTIALPGNDNTNTTSEDKSTERKQEVVKEAAKSPTNLATAVGAIFGLFFIGAVSCCVGASWAMACRRED